MAFINTKYLRLIIFIFIFIFFASNKIYSSCIKSHNSDRVPCGNRHHLKLTPEERQKESINLFDHFSELMPKRGDTIGLTTAQNGTNATLEEFQTMSQSIINNLPPNFLFIGLHNPPKGMLIDSWRPWKPINHSIKISARK